MKFNNTDKKTLSILLLISVLSMSMFSLNNNGPRAGTLDLSAISESITMSIPDIKGVNKESWAQDTHSILSYTWASFSSAGETSGSSKDQTGTPSFTEVSILKEADSASPSLFQACISGTNFKEVTISHWVVDSGGKGIAFLELKMESVVCNLYAFSGTVDDTPLESLSFNFSKITMTTVEIKSDGSAGTSNTAAWDLVRNEEP